MIYWRLIFGFGHFVNKFRFIIAMVIVGSTFPVHAYIDPGTGSVLLYVITGTVASLFFAIKGLFYRVADLVSGRKIARDEAFVAIHSEDRRYENTFVPIMHELTKLGVPYTYYTMYERDERCLPLPEDAKHKAIAPGLLGYAFLNKLKAKLLLTTTPQLEIMTFKRSRQVDHYCFVQHALGDATYMRPFPYDYFDSVMCCGTSLQENIRAIEDLRSAPPKQLLETGLPHYDTLLQRRQDLANPDETVVLVAPSWGELSLFKIAGLDFIDALSARFKVIVRPHPQIKISQPEILEAIQQIQGVEIDLNPLLDQTLARADLLISDFSGIIHEFAFIYEKPVLVANYEKDLESFEGFELNQGSTIGKKCAAFIQYFDPENMQTIADRVEETLTSFSVTQVQTIRSELIYNFGDASRVAAKQIQELTS